MNWDAARVITEIVFFFVYSGAWVYLLYASRQSATRKDFELLTELVTRHDEQLKHTPTQADVTDLRVGLADVGGEIKALAAEVHGFADTLGRVEKITDRITDWMLDNK